MMMKKKVALNWEGRDHTDEIESVRELNDWNPASIQHDKVNDCNPNAIQHDSSRGSRSGSKAAEKKVYRATPRPSRDSQRSGSFFKEPPTSRLFLDLEGVGHGKTPEQQREFQELVKSTGKQQVIVSDIKRVEELGKTERRDLEAQLKVLNRLSARCKGPNDQARQVLSLFRQCNPDEFGFITKENFVKEICPKFELSEEEGRRFFQLSKPSDGTEMTYLQFREAFKRLDRSTTFEPEQHRPHIKLVPPPPHDDNEKARDQKQKVGREKSFMQMSVDERKEYRHRNRIHAFLEHGRTKIKDMFVKRVNQGKDEDYLRTKLSYDEVASILRENRIDIEPDTVRKLYQKSQEEQGLTYSQLCRRTDEYFNDLEGNVPMDPSVAKMELKGQFLGCRALKPDEPPPKEGVSDFLAHHSAPQRQRRRRRRRGRRLDAIAEDGGLVNKKEEHLWKARWLDKTLVDGKKAPTSKRIVAGTSTKMREGNGDFIRWSFGLEDHPLESGRTYASETSSAMYTDRSYYSMDTERSLETSRSTAQTSSMPQLRY